MPGMPRKLKNFVLFVDGSNYAGEVSEVVPPKLTRKVEGFRTGTMQGDADAELGYEAMELTYSAKGFVHEQVKHFAADGIDGLQLRFVGAMRREDSPSYEQVEITARGRMKELDFGAQTAGAMNETKVSVSCTYFKMSVNGSTLVEIDIINMVENINGDDKLSAVRALLGLAAIL